MLEKATMTGAGADCGPKIRWIINLEWHPSEQDNNSRADSFCLSVPPPRLWNTETVDIGCNPQARSVHLPTPRGQIPTTRHRQWQESPLMRQQLQTPNDGSQAGKLLPSSSKEWARRPQAPRLTCGSPLPAVTGDKAGRVYHGTASPDWIKDSSRSRLLPWTTRHFGLSEATTGRHVRLRMESPLERSSRLKARLHPPRPSLAKDQRRSSSG